MKIAVLGANGRTGRLFIQLALSQGHTVNAAIHVKNNLEDHPNLTTMQVDISNLYDFKMLLSGQDSLVSFIGHIRGSKADMQTTALNNAITIMESKGPKRLISLTGTGIRLDGDIITFVDKVLNLGINFIDPSRVKDGRNHVEIIRNSNLNWTVIRVLKLQNSKEKPFKLTEHGPSKNYVSRTEVAKAAMEVLTQNTFIKKCPIISEA